MHKKYHHPPIPDGYQLYEERLDVAGIQHRRKAAARFAVAASTGAESEAWLALEPEPDNPADPDAIRLIGCVRESGDVYRVHVGYVPAEVADMLRRTGLVDVVQARLLKTYVGDGGFVEILFQIAGPKSRRGEYPGGRRRGKQKSTARPRRQVQREQTASGCAGVVLLAILAATAMIAF